MVLSNDFNVHLAHDGEHGLQKALELKPDLIILDLMLPKINGLELCAKFRGNPSLQHTKVVMVTAKDQPHDELKGLDYGANDYIMKPFEADELLHVVNQVMKE